LAEALDVDRSYLIFGEGEALIFSNDRSDEVLKEENLLREIDSLYNDILDRAKKHRGGLEHLFIELKRHFPSNLYR